DQKTGGEMRAVCIRKTCSNLLALPALCGIHALNSDVIPGASSYLVYHSTGIPIGSRKCFKHLGEELMMYTLR
ncbi:hypothetical protein KUCAC02_028981, partial [Chaenocephalus aceratus]